jgi:hypothetical protein
MQNPSSWLKGLFHGALLSVLIAEGHAQEAPSTATPEQPAAVEQLKEQAWRGYLDFYAFGPLQTTGTSTLNGISAPFEVGLSDLASKLNGALTARATVEYGRVGFIAGVNFASLTDSQSHFRSSSRSCGITQLKLLNCSFSGNLNTDADAQQTLIDLALRYRFGAIQQPMMKSGSFSVVPYAGARIVDANANLSADGNLKLTAQSPRGGSVTRERVLSSSRSVVDRTWVQPMIGLQANYALSDRWQLFANLDAAGFGVGGNKDLSGTAQAGIAYALGHSAQASLSWKYFNLAYAPNDSNVTGYSASNNGINLGLRWFFR